MKRGKVVFLRFGKETEHSRSQRKRMTKIFDLMGYDSSVKKLKPTIRGNSYKMVVMDEYAEVSKS